jgi:multiple sugar transport system substrate-binding protein
MSQDDTPRSHKGMTRRSAITVAAALAASIASAAPAMAQSSFSGTKLTMWGGLIFSDKANRLLVDTVNAWGAKHGVKTEVVMINQNETVQKVSAAVASNAMPDVLDLNLDLLLLLSRQGVFILLDDLYQSIGKAQGGWFPSVDAATNTTSVAKGRTGIPFGVSGNLLLRRTDLLSKAGFKSPPATWQELSQQAIAVTSPGVYGLGLALSNVNDGNVQLSILQSFGGRLADDTGKTVTIKSDATRTYLQWVKDAWDKKAFPPGVATWDGAGDNQAYLSGQTAFIANTGSVGSPRILNSTRLRPTRRCLPVRRARSLPSCHSCGPFPRAAATPKPPRL